MRALRIVVPLLSLALAAWLVLFVRAERAPRQFPPRAQTESRAAADSGAVRVVGIASAPSPAVEVAAPADPTPPCNPLGDLLVRVVDPNTRAGLPGITCFVHELPDFLSFATRTGAQLATGTTDATGEVVFEDLAYGGVLVAIPRDPPHAAGSRSKWIDGGSVAVCEIELGFGGVLSGRVVDDTGTPVVGMDIELAPSDEEVLDRRVSRGFGTPVARTDSAGRFRVEALASLQRWDAMRGEDDWYWREPVGLYVGPFATHLSMDRRFYVLEGDEIALGDLVVERERVVAGKVVGPDGRGIGAALVSAHRKRLDLAHAPRELRAGPSTTEFEVLPGEIRTSADGAFELRVRGDVESALVWTERGARARFPIPRIDPGERVDGIAWELERDEVLEVALRSGDGQPWEEVDTYPRSPRFTGVVLESTRGERVSLPLEPDADGIRRWTLPFPRDELALLHVDLPGHAPTDVTGEVLRQEGLVEIQLEAFPMLHLDLAVPGDDLFEWRSVEVSTCRLPPDERAKWGCCGYGNSVEATIRVERDCLFPVDLLASNASSQWVYVESYVWRAEDDDHAYGPLEPSSKRIALALPPLVPERGAELELQDSEDAESPAYCEVELFAVDAATGRAIVQGWQTPALPSGAKIDALGRLIQKVAVDQEAVTVAPLGFERRNLELPTLRASEIVPMGAIAFERETGRPRIRIIDPTRTSPPGMLKVLAATPNFDLQFEITGDGGLLPKNAVPESTAFLMSYAPDGRRPTLRSVELPATIPEDVLELSFAVPIPLEVRIVGLPAAALRTPLTVSIAPLDNGFVQVSRTRYDPIEIGLWRDFLPPQPDGTRTFCAWLGSGDYIVSVDGRWNSPGFLKRIHVSEESAPQVVELRYDAPSED